MEIMECIWCFTLNNTHFHWQKEKISGNMIVKLMDATRFQVCIREVGLGLYGKDRKSLIAGYGKTKQKCSDEGWRWSIKA